MTALEPLHQKKPAGGGLLINGGERGTHNWCASYCYLVFLNILAHTSAPNCAPVLKSILIKSASR